MDQTEITRLRRHDCLRLCAAARARIAASLALEDARAAAMAKELFADDTLLFGIVRRGLVAETGWIPLGFVHPQLLDGRRLRIASFAAPREVAARVEPYVLLSREIAARNRCMRAAATVARLALPPGARLGLIGSAGLEILTGRPYTNEASDLDCLLEGATAEESAAIYVVLAEIGGHYQLDIDLEIALPNGYGIKAKELFMQTQALLGKSLADVQLLPRAEVLQILNQKGEYKNGNQIACTGKDRSF